MKVFAVQKQWSVEVVWGASTNEQMVVEMPMKWHERIRAQLSEWTDEQMNWQTKESMNQSVNESENHWSNEAMTQWIKQPVNQWIDESVNQRLNEPMVARFRESMNHWISWISEPRKQWINEWSNLAKFIVQQRSDPFSFCDFSAQQILWNAHVALATVWCTFYRPHLPKVCRSLQCFAIFVWNRALATVSCAFCRRHLPKVVFCRPHLPKVQFLKWKSSTCYSPGRFLSTTFADRAPQLRKQRHFDDHGSHFTTKNAGFHARECLHPRIRTRLNCYTSQLLDDGWLTWWWEC